jgi:polyisoprenoid-binding protein YceI
MKTRTRWIVVTAAMVAITVVGGPFAYIHFIDGKAPAKLTLSASSTASSSATVTLDGTWSVAAGSQAGYRVGESIFGQNTTAVGRTSALTGTITISGTSVTSGSFTADLTAVKSDQSGRDKQFQGRIMETATFPKATFTLTKPIDFGATPASGATVTATATGDLTLHGTAKVVSFTVTARRNGATLQVLGSIPVRFADYTIPNPSLAGVVTTQDHGILEFLLNFTKGTTQLAAPATTTPTTVSPTAGSGPNSASVTSYTACLKAHGATVPTPSAAGGENGPAGSPPGGAGGSPKEQGRLTPQIQAAVTACASLRPAGGFGQPSISSTTVPPLGL